MSIEERRSLYLRLDQLLRMKAQGTATEVAEKLEISRSTFFRCLDEMRMMGAPIEFDELRSCYRYTVEGSFKFGFLQKKECKSISGGFIGPALGINWFHKNIFRPVSIFETVGF
jgi:biotin operon repressor